MADVSDGEIVLRESVQAIRDASFPGVPVYRGWPAPDALRKTLEAKAAIVTVSQRPGFFRDTTRYPEQEAALPSVPPSLTVTRAGNVATFAGTCTVDQIAGVQVGTFAWVARCTAQSTPATVAAALAGAAGGTASGGTLTLPGLVAARTARDVGTLLPTEQQEVAYVVGIWCASAEDRDRIGSAIAAGLSRIHFFTMPDGSAAHKRNAGGQSSDKAQNDGLLRRDLYYTIEITTTIRGAATPVLFPGAVVDARGLRALGAVAPPQSVTVVNGMVHLDDAGQLVGRQ